MGENRVVGVEASNLTKTYGRLRAVRTASFRIAAGETVALLGPNGAGKTTTIDMILGLARPDGGSVSVFGKPPKEAVRAGQIGGMLQTGSPLSFLSVRELVTMMASVYPHPMDVDEVLALTGASEFADRPTTKLSGGQAQRVRFAAAMVGDPDLLVLDEPTAAIDVEGRRDFWQSMRAVARQGKTVLFATHYLEEADAYADRVILMARGRIVADGPSPEIKARVGAKTIRATIPGSTEGLERLPGVTSVERHGEAVALTCSDSDATLFALLRAHPGTRDIEVRGAGLEEAFFELTADDDWDGDGQ